jgi:hypothetical protein
VNRELSKLPKAVRTMTLKEFVDKYNADSNAVVSGK